MENKKKFNLIKSFRIPLIVALMILIYWAFIFLGLTYVAIVVILAAIVLGSFGLFKEAFDDLLANQFALDYIAILAIAVSLVTKEFFVGSIIALMLSTGRTLEEYGANRAKQSLSLLTDRIPSEVVVEEKGEQKKYRAESIKVGQTIIIRKGEVVALDGILLSKSGLFDESSLTGEPYPVDKFEKDTIRSGTINVGDIAKIQVTKEEKNSTYKKIISMVDKAQKEKPPLVRLADKYSVIFTIITFVIASFAYFYSHSLEGVLAVLVVATPCPLILATPIALLGGVNAFAKKRIIVKNLASLETLSRVNSIVFDKTGTITLGKPKVVSFDVLNKNLSVSKLLGVSFALERNSLHPLAKAINEFSVKNKAPFLHADGISETVGKGITGIVDDKEYTLSKMHSESTDILIGLFEEKKHIATFAFADEIKKESKTIFEKLESLGLSLNIFTGDRLKVATKLVESLGLNAKVFAELSPSQKQEGISKLKNKGKTVAMVGDGINDAPALALADVGMVFSNEEQTAASEAADVVFLGGDFSNVLESLIGSKNTIGIAMQSIIWGIGLSILAMIFASIGLIPPIFGAILQELIDVAVILNALRASRS